MSYLLNRERPDEHYAESREGNVTGMLALPDGEYKGFED